jgi:AAA+ ATPase superfamily predicted ATPase
MFIDRKNELQQLSDLYRSDQGILFILYGRRRVGKTELLRSFCAEKPHIFFIATLSADSEQLASFSQQIWGFDHSETPAGFSFPSWEAAFRALANLPGRPVVVLDEFTYLISGNKAIPSILQKVWDDRLRNSRVMLVLCGSYIGMMETEVMGYNAPLYGRRTNSVLLQALDLPSSALFYPKYSPEERFLAWAVVGGMPYYLTTFSDRQTLLENIRTHILDAHSGSLYSEPRLLLMEELRELRNYFSLLRAIAQGNTRLNEIAQSSGIGSASTVARYLDILQQTRLITRRVPVTESQPEKSKRGQYQINDHFIRFWFRYVHPNQGSLELGLADNILAQRIKPDLDHFAAIAFEEAAREYIAARARAGKLPFLPDKIGSLWGRTGELDVVAISPSERMALVAECKWSVNTVGINIYEDFKQRADKMAKESNIEHLHYALFSRRGFTSALKEKAVKDDIGLFTVDDLVRGSSNTI